MGRLLEALRADSETRPPAKVAKVANITATEPERFADSQDSQRIGIVMRTRLLTIASAECIDTALIDQRSDDLLAEYHDCTDATLLACLRAWDADARMDAGQAPQGYTQAVQCSGCGPVLLWPGSPQQVIACPWCFRRKAGKAIPRPPTDTTQEHCA